MLVGRALAAVGSGVRVYRYDATWPVGRLIEAPPRLLLRGTYIHFVPFGGAVQF